jgi:hypothetical protein
VTAPTVARGSDDGRLLVRPAALGRRRPVLSFVGLIALVVLVLLAVGRSGVLAPQVEVHTTGSLGDGSTTCATTYSVLNAGLRPVEVVAVDQPDVRLAPLGAVLDSAEAMETLRPADLPPFAPFTIPGGGHRTVAVAYPCTDAPDDDRGIAVEVRSADLGLRRTVHPSY